MLFSGAHGTTPSEEKLQQQIPFLPTKNSRLLRLKKKPAESTEIPYLLPLSFRRRETRSQKRFVFHFGQKKCGCKIKTFRPPVPSSPSISALYGRPRQISPPNMEEGRAGNIAIIIIPPSTPSPLTLTTHAHTAGGGGSPPPLSHCQQSRESTRKPTYYSTTCRL